MIFVLFGVTLIIFAMIHLVPGDPAFLLLGDRATEEKAAELRHQLGLDHSLYCLSTLSRVATYLRCCTMTYSAIDSKISEHATFMTFCRHIGAQGSVLSQLKRMMMHLDPFLTLT